MYWWDGDPAENIYMEVTRRTDIGGDLEAPLSARGGSATASYVLVPTVRPGDLIVHYDSSAEAIVGVSVAISAPEPTQTYWVARGRSAREAGAQPGWLPGIRVPLDNFTPVRPAVQLAELRGLEAQLMAVRDDLQRAHGGAGLYFPWIPYRGRPMRTFPKLPGETPATRRPDHSPPQRGARCRRGHLQRDHRYAARSRPSRRRRGSISRTCPSASSKGSSWTNKSRWPSKPTP